MKLMLYEWDAFMQTDMEEVLKRMKIDYRAFWYPFVPKLAEEDEYFEKHFCEALTAGDYDAVFSFNFRTVVAKCCDKMHIPYISWIFDSPFGVSEKDEILRLPTNYIFIFDGYEYRRLKNRKINTVYHLPLAVNIERLDTIVPSENDKQKYGAEVSFVGMLYHSTFGGFSAKLPQYELGMVESVVESASKLYGSYFLDKFTDGEMCSRLRSVLENGNTEYDHIFHESLQSIIAKEITRRERLTLLYLLSQSHQVALYSNRIDDMLDRVDYRGVIDSYDEVYRVYKTSKINLNISFKRIAEGMPLRVLDILGAGGFLLSNYQQELVEQFTPGVDCEVYESMEDAMAKVDYYLKNEDKRLEIAANGRESAKRFSFENQINKMLDIVFGEGKQTENDKVSGEEENYFGENFPENKELVDRITEGLDDFEKGYIGKLIHVWQMIGDPAIISESLREDVADKYLKVRGKKEMQTMNAYEKVIRVTEDIVNEAGINNI